MPSGFKPPEEKNVLKIAYPEGWGPVVLDPVDSWYDISNDLIRQVCDTLWVYDLTNPDFPLIMRLTTNYSWNSGIDELTISLRDDVWFHDGTKFNATAVKFTFDRIMYFINWSGDLPEYTHLCAPAELFFDLNKDPILNRTEIIDEYTIKFVLNNPNGVFLPLLTYEACSILGSNSANTTEYLVLVEDILVGTGPFKYIHYIPGEEIQFERWNLYWDSNTFWDRIIWQYFPGITAANNALLDGCVDYIKTSIKELLPTFQSEEEIIVIEMNTSINFRYWAINTEVINDFRIRKAIAYAYNYSYYIEKLCQRYVIKAEQFLAPGFPYYNESFKAPYYNTTIARQIMMEVFPNKTTGLTSQPFGENATNDVAWSALELETYGIFEHVGWITGVQMNEAFINDMDKIGIYIHSHILDWAVYPPIEGPYEIRYDAYALTYLEPFNILGPILNNMSNYSQWKNNDFLIHQWLEQYEGIDPANTTRRAQILYKIQQRAINELYLLLPLTFDKMYYVHHRSLGGVSYNIMNHLWLTDSYYIPGISTI